MQENRYRIEAVFQAGQMLKTIANSRDPLGPSELAKALGITNNTAFRLCVTLEECGFLTQAGDKYSLGMGLALFWARKITRLGTEKERVEKDIESLIIKGEEDATDEPQRAI